MHKQVKGFREKIFQFSSGWSMNESATKKKEVGFGFEPTASICLQSIITLPFVKKNECVEKKQWVHFFNKSTSSHNVAFLNE